MDDPTATIEAPAPAAGQPVLHLRSEVPMGPSEATVQLVTEVVAEHYHLRAEDIWSATRRQPIAQARQLTRWILVRLGYRPQDIGRVTAPCAHGVVRHSEAAIEDLRSVYAQFRGESDKLLEVCRRRLRAKG